MGGMHIDIHVPRPGALLLGIFAVLGWGIALSGGGTDAPVQASVLTEQVSSEKVVEGLPVGETDEEVDAGTEDIEKGPVPRTPERTTATKKKAAVTPTGGDDTPLEEQYSEAEQEAMRAREERDLLQNKQEILREQLARLQDQRLALGAEVDPDVEKQFQRATQLLISLIQDEKRAEQFLKTSLNQMREAESRAVALTVGKKSNSIVSLLWPVQPLLGISAYFEDEGYVARFHMEHHAIDIPVNQGSDVYAAAGGIVAEVQDHGLGFNYIVVEHPGGYSTLYGHLTKFTVTVGQRVFAGDLLGYSGGRPGTEGAGMSTGPHLHFAMYKDGKAVDPLLYLPASSGI